MAVRNEVARKKIIPFKKYSTSWDTNIKQFNVILSNEIYQNLNLAYSACGGKNPTFNDCKFLSSKKN